MLSRKRETCEFVRELANGVQTRMGLRSKSRSFGQLHVRFLLNAASDFVFLHVSQRASTFANGFTTTQAQLRPHETRLEPTLNDLPKPASSEPAPASSAPPAKRSQASSGRSSRARREVSPEEKAAIEALWAEYRRVPGDETRNRLVESYQTLVREIVRRFAMRLPRTVDRGDLDTAANVGLMSAVEGFDPERGVRFESYCELRVKGALLDELRSQDWLPRPWRQRLELHKRVLERLRSELGAEPTDEAVASVMRMDVAEYRQIFGKALPGAPAGSMPAGEGSEDALPSLEVVPDTNSDPPGERLTREELLHLVTQKLTEQEQRIIYLKYWEELPMREIGLLTGLSESRVCKIHARLLERLKDRFRVNVQD